MLTGLGVRIEPQEAYSQSQKRKQEPAYQAKIKIEQIVLPPFHHRHAQLNGLVHGKLRIILQNIIRHGV